MGYIKNYLKYSNEKQMKQTILSHLNFISHASKSGW